ncbi:MAG TPA: ABC transporter permease, partial [Verrucomicrobiae bacterium]|nr:ABC transporter permease [Verrucomicrobiae bacterium]
DRKVDGGELSVDGQNAGAVAINPQPSTLNPPHLSPNQRAWRRFRNNRPAVIGLWFLLLVGLFVLIYPLFAPFRPEQLSDAQFQPPNRQHWLGTDVHGRDLLVRLCHGAQISLMVGLFGASVCLIIGVLWGSLAGYVGGRLDGGMMRVVDILYSMPSIILAVVLMAVLEPVIKNWLAAVRVPNIATTARVLVLFVALGAVSWLTMARIVRGQVLSLRARAFVEASRSLGAGPMRILSRHIIPNIFGVVIVYLTLSVPAIVLYESFLSFLGIGIQPPMASWGSLMAEGADQMNPIRIYWWLLVFPGGVLVTTLLALNFLGDGLRDAWDVRGN